MPKGVETIALSAIAVFCIGTENGQLRPLGAASHPIVMVPFKVIGSTHGMAAEVELATPETERWIVETETLYEGRGRVYLELADGTDAEAERGVAGLRVLQFGKPQRSEESRASKAAHPGAQYMLIDDRGATASGRSLLSRR
jgi:hypothetical protein